MARNLVPAAMLACVGAVPALAQTAVPLAPHRAVYDLSLLSSKGSEPPAAARGRIVYELNGNSCEGYTVSFRQATELVTAEGRQQLLDTRSTTFESGDGKSFRFRIESLVNGQRSKLLEGSAERADGSLSVRMRNPTPAKADIDTDALFPVQQTLRGLAAARAGDNMLEMNSYDGTDNGQKVFQTLNIIGKPMTKPSDDMVEKNIAMQGMRRWPLVVSYFDKSKPDGTPIYTLSFEMWDNGISSNLKLDYGEFVLGGKISQFELLKAPPCTPNAPKEK